MVTAAELLAEIGDCRTRYPLATRSPAIRTRPRLAREPRTLQAANANWMSDLTLTQALKQIVEASRER